MGKIEIGLPIFTRDGQEAGETERVVVNPETGSVTHIVARQTGLLTHDVVIPMDDVTDCSTGGVTLALSAIDLEVMPEYREDDYVSPEAEEVPVGLYRHCDVLFEVRRAQIGEGASRDLAIGSTVSCMGETCGVVDELLLDPVSGTVVALRVGHRGQLTRDVIVPVEWILDRRGGRVNLDCNIRQIEEELPPAPAKRSIAA